MKAGAPFGLAGIWENRKAQPQASGCGPFDLTTDANDLVADVHDRMPVILTTSDYARWLGEEPDPSDLMRPYPAELIVADLDAGE